MSTHIQMETCKRRLAVVWLIGAGVLFVLMMTQSLTGRYNLQTREAWGWLLPTLMPTMSLIVGVLAMEIRGPKDKARPVDPFLYHLAMGLSVFYLVVVAATILAKPFLDMTAIEAMNLSNLWLGPLQGLVSAMVGVFYVKQ